MSESSASTTRALATSNHPPPATSITSSSASTTPITSLRPGPGARITRTSPCSSTSPERKIEMMSGSCRSSRLPCLPWATNLPRSLHRPVFHLQTTHSPEFPLVVGDQLQPRRLGMRRDPQVVIPDHLALAFQFRSDRSVSFCRRLRQAQHGKHFRQLAQQFERRCPLSAFLRPVHQFAKRNHRERRLSLLERAKSPQHLLRFFSPDVNAGVRVQQEARLHHSPLRFCGLSFPRPASVKSAGNAASRSNARAITPWRSRRTISSPRREISTSLLFTRNAFGSRTAWLFPDLNTFAVAIFTPLNVYTSSIHVLRSALQTRS